MAIKLGRIVVYVDGVLLAKSPNILITRSCDYSFTNLVPSLTKLGRIVTNLKGLLPITLLLPIMLINALVT